MRNQNNAVRKVRLFSFTVTVPAEVKKFEKRPVREARKRVSEMPIKDFLEGVLSEVLIDTMIDRGFVHIGDIWPDSKNVRRLVPSYGKIKNQRVQDLVEGYFTAEKSK